MRVQQAWKGCWIALWAAGAACASGEAGSSGGSVAAGGGGGGTYRMRMTNPPGGYQNSYTFPDKKLFFSFLLDRAGWVVDIRNESKQTTVINWEESIFIDPSGKTWPLFRVNKMGRRSDSGQSKISAGQMVSEYLAAFGLHKKAEEPERLFASPWPGMDPVGLYQQGKFVSDPLFQGPVTGKRIQFAISAGGELLQFEFALSGNEWPATTEVEAMRMVASKSPNAVEALDAMAGSREEKIHRYLRNLIEHSVDPAIREKAARTLTDIGDANDLPFLKRMWGIENLEPVKQALNEAITAIESR